MKSVEGHMDLQKAVLTRHRLKTRPQIAAKTCNRPPCNRRGLPNPNMERITSARLNPAT